MVLQHRIGLADWSALLKVCIFFSGKGLMEGSASVIDWGSDGEMILASEP